MEGCTSVPEGRPIVLRRRLGVGPETPGQPGCVYIKPGIHKCRGEFGV